MTSLAPGGGSVGADVAALFADVPGQERAVAQLVAAAANPSHAYLLVGPAGTGGLDAAAAFAAALLGGAGNPDVARRARAFAHPDVRLYQREGASLSIGDARDITKLAYRAPVEAERMVVVVPDLHLVRDSGPALLKTVEEPPPGIHFVLLADLVPPELVTIASRCVVIDLEPLSEEVIVAALLADGVTREAAEAAAASSAGRLDRARLLAGDPGFASRQAFWRRLPDALDGTGATVAQLVDELQLQVESILEPLAVRQARELVELDRLDEIAGRKRGRKEVEDRHKRELRRVRTDELQAGLATLAGTYRDRLAAGRAEPTVFAAIREAEKHLVRNPNEALLLSALLLRLSPRL
jgi:DNA polymerase-3 subunit delta'